MNKYAPTNVINNNDITEEEFEQKQYKDEIQQLLNNEE